MVERTENTRRDVAFDADDIIKQRPPVGEHKELFDVCARVGLEGPLLSIEKLDTIVGKIKEAQAARNTGNSEPGK